MAIFIWRILGAGNEQSSCRVNNFYSCSDLLGTGLSITGTPNPTGTELTENCNRTVLRARPRAISVPTTDLAALECHLPRCKSFR